VENTINQTKKYIIEIKNFKNSEISSKTINTFVKFSLPEKNKNFDVILEFMDKADDDMLLSFLDRTKNEFSNKEIVTIASSGSNNIAKSKILVSEFLQNNGLEASKLAKEIGNYIGGGGGGSKAIGQAGGGDYTKLKNITKEELEKLIENVLKTNIEPLND
jgi:alanyl-tRNA synthetase